MGQGRSRHGFKEARQVIVFPKFNWSIHMALCSLSITTPEIPGNAETLRPREAERSEEHDPDSAHSPPHLLTGGCGTWGDALSFSNRSMGNINPAKTGSSWTACIYH